jgi:hypothetical protein
MTVCLSRCHECPACALGTCFETSVWPFTSCPSCQSPVQLYSQNYLPADALDAAFAEPSSCPITCQICVHWGGKCTQWHTWLADTWMQATYPGEGMSTPQHGDRCISLSLSPVDEKGTLQSRQQATTRNTALMDALCIATRLAGTVGRFAQHCGGPPFHCLCLRLHCDTCQSR